jgi:hypothetical protein
MKTSPLIAMPGFGPAKRTCSELWRFTVLGGSGQLQFSLHCVRKQMIIDPPGEDRRLHRHDPRLRQRPYPNVQLIPRCPDRPFPVDLTARILYLVMADQMHSQRWFSLNVK